MEIITIETPSLGDRSYLVTDGEVAAAIDPQRDIDRLESMVAERGLRLTHVFETHIHNDYVTGGRALAERAGATYVVAAGDDVSFGREAANDGDEFTIGRLTVRAVHTPGHTPTHLSYIVLEDGDPQAAFTGGSMLYGTVGRTDLISADATESLTKAQFHSVRRLAEQLPDPVGVHPTHGFGSFCSSTSTTGSDASTIGNERKTNLALTIEDEDEFVRRVLSGLTAYPRYYAHMAPLNRSGPPMADLAPPREVTPEEIRESIAQGAWVVDLRSRAAFARGHVVGTLNLEATDSFVTYLGWTLPWGTPITLVADTADEVAEAQRQLVRIGIDRLAGAASGGLEAWGRGAEIGSYRTATFADLANAQHADGFVVLDVRRDDEWAEGNIAGAVHIPLHSLESRFAEVPDGEVWVHCASGYRAALAASMLDRAGRAVVAVDDAWEDARRQGVKVTPGA